MKQPIEIAPGIFWVGAVDWNIRDFHGYSTERGTTYNAYLLMDEKPVLIDTVKEPFAGEMLERVSQVIAPSKVSHIIANHGEMDHSGALPALVNAVGPEKPVICSKMGAKSIAAHMAGLNLTPVADGGTLNIGRRTLSFLETRMLHWPDSMFTYAPDERILFSSDAFGQHYGGPERFDDEIGDAIMPFAKKYFANILLLYAPLIEKLIAKVTEMKLAVDMICPDHGVMWRKEPGKIISAYADWSAQKPANRAAVVYDTMWKSTEKMAHALVESLNGEGVATRLLHLRANDRSDVMTEVFDSGIVALGSPTLNNGMFPTVADFLCYMKGLKPKNKIGAAFGSYGWSGEAANLVHQELSGAGFEMSDPALRALFVPNADATQACYDLGKKLADLLKQKMAS